MGSMSYCRWENVKNDLTDCFRSMDNDDDNELSDSEDQCRIETIGICHQIIEKAEEMDIL